MFDLSTIRVPAHIENPGAYRAAVARKIQQRQYEARRQRVGEKLAVWLSDPANMALFIALGAEERKPRPNDFLCKMLNAVREWGSLTDGQAAAARKCLADRDARAQERVAANAAKAAVSRHVGTEGFRGDFRVKLIRRWSMDGMYGTSYGHIFEDASGNELVYIGSVELDMAVDETRTIRGTIKAHGERDGVKQTRLNRVVVEEDDGRASEDEFLAKRFSATGKGAITL